MSWLLGKIAGFSASAPGVLIAAALLGALLGGTVAWKIQGVRLDRADHEFTQYRQNLASAVQDARDDAEKRRIKAMQEYVKLSGELNDEIQKNAVYRRCVAAGKCGRVQQPASENDSLQATGRIDAAGAHTIPASRDDAAPGVVNDCALTTLMLNRLQADIEAQPGYAQ